jgi:hypothetical protein
MPLWTDIIDPVEATGIARAEQYLYEQQWGTLARYLPNVFVASDHVKFFVNANGLVDEARYRAYNAAPEIGKGQPLQSRTIDLPAISRNEPIDERTQKELRRLPDDQIRKSLESAIRRTVQSISDRQERTRGVLIETGKVLVDTDNFLINDDFGRDAALTVTASTLWATGSVDRLAALETWCALYASKNNGKRPGSVLMSRAVYAAFASGDQFRTQLVNGASRPALQADVLGSVEAAGLPPIDIYDRSTKSGRVLSANKLFLLPEQTDPENEDGTDLGATFWGQTVSADSPEFGIESGEQPGVVVGVYREDRIPYTVEVMGDSIGEPVARNANASMAVAVLA